MTDAARELTRLLREQAVQRAEQGDPAYARELGARLATGYEAALQQMQEYREGLAGVVRLLALTPGRNSLAELVRLLDDTGARGAHSGDALVASLLAEAQSPADLAEVVYDRPDRDRLDELRACLFHELLLRGVDVQAHHPLARWPRVRPSRQPLSWLPDARRPFESGSTFPTRSVWGSAYDVPTGLPIEGRLNTPAPCTTEPVPLRNLVTPDLHESIVAAPRRGDFGHYDAWVFELEAPLDVSLMPALLPTLPMACVAPTSGIAVARRPLADIWPMLFGTASMGGCYGGGVHGAWGRRAAWWSIAGLCGAPAGASAEEVERLALDSVWFHFECDSGWFHNEMSDYGIATLSPDGRRIAVLAATDTD